ncbi:hypothetical protein AVEN_138720-1 [Araneus ventricosus]|uniref:Mutator-like transposase domain-containing protein n=1 Tax=Araneus ventricosus TaxID=182803 RepID=A0A4Y2IPQ3_ARAVE|nr:hypothetical protein AVEN_138720-1 [Araneus ventricosus]
MFSYLKNVGLGVVLNFKCTNSLCTAVTEIHSDPEISALNELALLTLSTGSGFSQECEKFAARYMSKYVFASCEKTTEKVLDSTIETNLVKSIQEEKKLADERNDIDKDGFFCVTAVVDGGWCKRSYGHGYNASSGVAFIIGLATQKIIFIDIRNKVCLTCHAIETGRISSKTHVCHKNWDAYSTSMESNIIVEGMKYLESIHNIRCTRVVGDGDSNIIKRIKDEIGYGNRVLKVECANHAVRRYSRALEKLQRDTRRFSGKSGVRVRNILKQNIGKLAQGARALIKKHAILFQSEPSQTAIQELVSNFRNFPRLVFQQSSKSNPTNKMPEESSELLSLMESSGMLRAIDEEINRVLVSCSNTLIYNVTNNPAENYMNQFCKTSGGKRIDFAKAGSIGRRAKIAALAYQQPAQQWHKEVNKFVTGRSPTNPLRKFLSRRNNEHLKRIKRRQIFSKEKERRKQRKYSHVPKGGDKNYGDFPEKPDITEEMYQIPVANPGFGSGRG